MMNALLSAGADAVVGAEWGQPSPERTAQRKGYRNRELDTRVGTVDVAIPNLRSGTYFPEWLLERRKRAEAALITVAADYLLAGVSTRRMDKLVKALGFNALSKSQVSRMAADLDEHVDRFRHRPLGEAGSFTFVAADAPTMKVREGGRVINAVVLVATGGTDTVKCSARGWPPARPGRRGTASSRPRRPRPDRAGPGHLRRARRPARGDRREPARGTC